MTLESSDNLSIEVPFNIAQMFVALCPDEDETENNTHIPCLRIAGKLLQSIVDYCKMYQVEAMTPIDVKGKETLDEVVTQEKYLTFIKDFETDELFKLIQAANYAQINSLLSLAVLALCSRINNKTEDEIRNIFNITKPHQQSTAN